MKQRILLLVSFICLLSFGAKAQENIKSAFEKFIKAKNVNVTKSIMEERDFTKKSLPLISKAETYNFIIKQKDRKLISEVLNAFEKDRTNKDTYLFLTHTGGHGVPTNARALFVGNDRKNAVNIGIDEMQSWQLICLIDPADYTRSHRYAYAIEWNNDPKQQQLSGKIRGRLIVTYSRIPDEVINAYTNQINTTSKVGSANSSLNDLFLKKVEEFGSYNFIRNKTEALTAFEALKTEFLKGNTTTSTGSTITMSIYTLCSWLAEKKMVDSDLRQKMRDDLTMMINRCDRTNDLGRSHIGYLELAIKALK